MGQFVKELRDDISRIEQLDKDLLEYDIATCEEFDVKLAIEDLLVVQEKLNRPKWLSYSGALLGEGTSICFER